MCGCNKQRPAVQRSGAAQRPIAQRTVVPNRVMRSASSPNPYWVEVMPTGFPNETKYRGPVTGKVYQVLNGRPTKVWLKDLEASGDKFQRLDEAA